MSSTQQWPPAPTTAQPWHEQVLRLREDGGLKSRVTVRMVGLWGREVLIDEAHRVYCPDCWAFIEVARLASPFNGHFVGLRSRGGGTRPVIASPPEWDDEPVNRRAPDALPESW